MTGLIHIGLAKAASTYLQSVWHLSPHHRLHDVAPFLSEAREHMKGGRPLPAMTANPVGSADAGSAPVISSEGLSQAYLNETAHQRALPRYRKEIAHSVARAGLARHALLVVREPLSWLRSLHEQSLKQGEHRNFRDFLDHQRAYVTGVTDLAALAADWSDAGFSLVVLPVEWLREDEDRFWATLAERTGLPVPSRAILKRVRRNRHWLNRTVGDRRPFLQQANRLLAGLRTSYGNLKDLPPELLRERYVGFLETRDDFPADLLSRYRQSLAAPEATAGEA
ncbi:MAG: hypothetical protein ACE5ED_10225 [Rhodothalassiaceae bacterium]